MEKVRPLTVRQKYILNDFFKRSINGETMEEIASSHGISRKTLSTWKNCEEGLALQKKFSKDMSSTKDIPDFYHTLARQMRTGSAEYLKIFARVHGLYEDKKEILAKVEQNQVQSEGFSVEELAELEALLNEESTLNK